MNSFRSPLVLAITDATCSDLRNTLLSVEKLATWAANHLAESERGRVVVGLRDHNESARTRLAWGRLLRQSTLQFGLGFIVHDRLDLAKLLDADGIHLGVRSLNIADARQIIGDRPWIGRSTHNLDQVQSARRDGADYVTLSPVFASPGKGEPLGELGFSALAAASGLPTLALGGVRLNDFNHFRRRGSGIACIRDWLRT